MRILSAENGPAGQWRLHDQSASVDGRVFCEVPHSSDADVELALDAAHAARESWGRTSTTDRSRILLKIADKMEANLDLIAQAETWDNGKPIRETTNADIPLVIDHFRYFAGCIRAQEGGISEIDATTYAYHFHEPLGVVGQIIPWNFPILMAAWKIEPALAAGNTIVLKPAETTPASLLVVMDLIADILPPGTLNIVNGLGKEVGSALAGNKRIAKIAFTGSTAVGQRIAHQAAENIIPATLELGGKSPNISFADIMDKDDAYFDKALEGFTMFALNQGQICSCPSCALVQESIFDAFMERAIARVKVIKQGNPFDHATMMGAQNSTMQQEKILSYIKIGREEGAELLTGGDAAELGDGLDDGFYIQPTVFKGHNKMRIFQEEIFGPVLAVTTFKTEEEALAIANDTEYGLGVACGAVTRIHASAWGVAFSPVASESIAITPIPRIQPLVDIRNRASDVRRIR